MSGLVFFTTAGCSLCEQALDLILGLPHLRGLELTTVDIASDDALVERYGDTIPVVRFGTSELAWPFTADHVIGLLQTE